MKKMSKNELLQKTCSICNRIGFSNDFKQIKFSEIKYKDLLQPTNELINIVPGVEENNSKKNNVTKDTEENILKNEDFENSVNVFCKTSNMEIAPEVVICEDMNVNNGVEIKNKKQKKINDIDKSYDSQVKSNKTIILEDPTFINSSSNASNLKTTYVCYKNRILYTNGIELYTNLMNDDKICNICSNCFLSLNSKKAVTPDFSPANHSFIGDVPEELQNLTIPEEQLISLYRHNKCVIKIQARSYDASTRQSKISGNVIVFQQNISSIAQVLPLPPESLCDNIKVVFVGSNPPCKVETKRLLQVRRDKVYKALRWLINNNPLYKDIELSSANINNLPIDDIPDSLWITMDSTTNIEAANGARCGYADETCTKDSNCQIDDNDENNVQFSNNDDEETLIGLTASALVDIDGVDTSTDEIQNHLLKHIFENKKDKTHTDNTYYMIPRSETPINQYYNPLLLLGLFPTLFPYGLGSPTNPNRKEKTAYKIHLQYLLSYHDKRFEKHYSFIFVVFNILQRRNACYYAKLMMNQPYSQSYAQEISKVKADDIKKALAIIANKGKDTYFQINSDVSRLAKQVKAVGGNVPGSAQARSKLRTNIHSLIYRKGLPSIFITINPADICNPVALYLAGVDLDLGKIINETFPSGYVRSQIIASHPVSTAKFFNYLISIILSTLIMGGVLGPMDSYFGTVECQGRGSLHLHMLLWLLSKLKPRDVMEKIQNPEFRASFLSYLEDIIKESLHEFTGEDNCNVPESAEKGIILNELTEIKDILKYVKGDLPAACFLTPNPEDLNYDQIFRQDIINLVTESNIHRHNATCYKYAKATDKNPTCRMRFPRAKVENSSIDIETGDLRIKRTHEWLNNFNDTIISACRCNMDIKYIFSGKDAKALCYYITDYVTKSNLSFYDIFSLIHTAVKSFEEQPQDNVNQDQDQDMFDRSRRLILKCYNVIASKNELSGVQVASYLMNWGDHYTNEKFENIFIIGIERYLQTGLDRARNITNIKEQITPITETVEEDNENDVNTEEITMEIDKNDEQFNLKIIDNGKSFILVNQRVDYENRSEKLKNVCLYKFVCKYRKKRKDKTDERHLIEQDIDENNRSKKNRGRPAQNRYIFNKNHPQKSTHILVERVTEIIPVLIGPQIPRKDREATRERYCRAILALFIPWRTVTDLCSPDESWIEAWIRHQTYICGSDCEDIIENIELLHECKEHRNEHLTQIIEQLDNENVEPPFYASLNKESDTEDEVDEDFSNVIDKWDNLSYSSILRYADFNNAALDALAKTNRFQINEQNYVNLQNEDAILKFNPNEEEIVNRKIYSNVRSLIPATMNLHRKNNEWQSCLKIEKEKLRKQIIYGDSNVMSDIKTTNFISVCENTNKIETIPAPGVVVGRIDITTQQSIISRYTLHETQTRAFIIITDHIEGKSFLKSKGRQKQLIMCIPASAGTGKSHLNKALTEYFKVTGRLSMLRKLAPTSVAANEMGDGGLTMQSFLYCRLPKIITNNRKSTIEMEWKHIKYVILDEFSMVGLDSIANLSRLMSLAREDWADSSVPFGGKNLIILGDPLQYDPIMDKPVYENILDPGYQLKNKKEILKECLEKQNESIELLEKSKEEQKQENDQAKLEKRKANVLLKINNKLIRQKVGRALWLQINAVVIIKEQQRTTDKCLLDIQSRIREGKVTESDYKELSKRVVGKGNKITSLSEPPWNSAPIITYKNDLRTLINHRAVALKAIELKTPLIVSVANDTYSITSNIKSEKMKEISRYILSLDDNNTQSLPGYLPLFEGMPVILTRSLFTELGVSNGTIDILKQLIYEDEIDDESCISDVIDKNRFPNNTIYIRKPVFALIELINPKLLPKMKDLPPKIIPIPLQKQNFYVDLSKILPPALRKICKAPNIKVTRIHFPIVPAFSYTSHKSQGQTVKKIVLDLNFPPPPPPFANKLATIYVPLTRVKQMEDLAFFREFPISSLQIQPSIDQKNEIKRLEQLNNQTIREYEKQYPSK